MLGGSTLSSCAPTRSARRSPGVLVVVGKDPLSADSSFERDDKDEDKDEDEDEDEDDDAAAVGEGEDKDDDEEEEDDVSSQ